ncbi:MAG: T9SS type A sorting domain-containing protein [Bacteroidetes bacterium]|nr:T9SS type A sorting domain-containing protein [Bacteroidota bacterium]
MKKLYSLLLVLPAFVCVQAQNGLGIYKMPAGYTINQVRFKNALAVDKNNNEWIAFKSIGAAKFDGTNWTVYSKSNSGIPSDTVNALAVDAGNSIWLGTNAGVAKFNGSNWTVYNKSNSGIASDTVIAVAVNGNSVYAGTRRGVSVFNGSSWTTYSVSNSGIVGDTVNAIEFAGSSVYFGTTRGLSQLSGSNWTTYNASNSGLKNNIILSFYYDGSNLWFGTNGGIHQYSGGIITPLDSLYSIAPFQFPAGISITKGFQGGILFDWDGVNLAEFIPSSAQLKIYYLPNTFSSGAASRLFQKDASGVLWFVNRIGADTNRVKLFSFDFSNYVTPAPGCYTITPDNLKLLDINQVSAAVLNRGDLHWNPMQQSHGLYEVPKGSGTDAVYASAIWFGGLDSGGQLHLSGQEYRNAGCDLYPGPIGVSNPSAYDKIWKLDRYKVEEFKYYWAKGDVQNGTYIPDQSILTWPAINDTSYAPFVDINANGIYDPLTGGDYPKIKGDQCLYFIMNDSGVHGETGCLPMNVEIHAMAYAFTCPQLADSEQTLNYTTLYHYEFFNKSANVYNKTYFGYWQDVDLGCATNDYVGCYPAGNYGYYYNGDSIDLSCSGELGYGYPPPPILSTVILNGALADANDSIDNDNDGTIDEAGEKNLMTDYSYFINGAAYPMRDPASCVEFYNYMESRWEDSTAFTYGGNGYNGGSGTPTRFVFPSFPWDTGWSEVTAGNTPGDRRGLIGSGPFTFNPAQRVDYDFAIVWTRDTTLPFMSKAIFDKNLRDTKKIQEWFAKDSFPSCLNLSNLGIQETSNSADDILIYPNPSEGKFTIYNSKLNVERIEIYNLLGEKIYSSTPNAKLQTINLSAASGIYFLTIKTEQGTANKKIIISAE